VLIWALKIVFSAGTDKMGGPTDVAEDNFASLTGSDYEF
jgi:hypothetical protein